MSNTNKPKVFQVTETTTRTYYVLAETAEEAKEHPVPSLVYFSVGVSARRYRRLRDVPAGHRLGPVWCNKLSSTDPMGNVRFMFSLAGRILWGQIRDGLPPNPEVLKQKDVEELEEDDDHAAE